MHLELVEAVDEQEFLRMLQTLMEDRPDQSPFKQPQSQQVGIYDLIPLATRDTYVCR